MRVKISFCVILFIIGLVGCSSYDAISISPSIIGDKTAAEPGPIAGVSDYDGNNNPAAGMGVLGLFQLNIDLTELDAELVPLRNTSSTDVLEVVDITNFLRLFPCTDCAKIASIGLDPEEHIALRIGIRHPFATGEPLKPITGRNRADLHVFNVEGILASQSIGESFPDLMETVSQVKLVNADGYTKYLDPSLDEFYSTTATIHPYILHFDDYSAGNYDPMNPMGFESVTTPPPSGNLVMAMGCDFDYQDYIIKPPEGESLSILYAVGCAYGISADSFNQRFSPVYRVPQHNKKAASEVTVTLINDYLFEGCPQSYADIEVHVVDISHGVAVGSDINEMLADSSVDDIYVSVPDITTMTVIDGGSSSGGSGHDPSDPLIYQCRFYNTQSPTPGLYFGLVKVKDNYAPKQNTNPLLNGMDGIKRVGPYDNPLTGLFEIAEFATYQIFDVKVYPNSAPEASLKSIPEPAMISPGQTVELDASGSTDLEDGTLGLPLKYEFDWDYDGVTFTVDHGPTDIPITTTDPYMNPGSFNAAVRVTDSGGLSDIETVLVSVLDATDGRIAFMHGTNDIYTCLRDGTDIKNIGIRGYYPCISQDNNVIVYASGLNGNIRACNIDGTNDRLVFMGNYKYPSVCADGSKLVFYQDISEPTYCCSINTDGTGFVRISPRDNGNWRYPLISGAGNRVVMHREHTDAPQYAVYTVNLDGSSLKWVTENSPTYPIRYGAITYNGDYVFYSTPTQVRRVKWDGTGDTTIRSGFEPLSTFAINPSGSKLCYSKSFSGYIAICSYDIATQQETRLTFDHMNIGMKTITQSGTWVIFESIISTNPLLTIKTDGSMTDPVLIDSIGKKPSSHGTISEHI